MDQQKQEAWGRLVDPSRHGELKVLIDARNAGIISAETFETRAISLAMPAGDGPAEIAKHLAQANRQHLEPWRVGFEAAVAQWDLAVSRASDTANDLRTLAREQFVVKARAKALSVEEAMFGSYVCIMEDGNLARGILYHLLFEVPASIRIERHNWYMLNQYPELERSSIANQVAKLKVPLFPPFGALKALNETIMSDTALVGGGKGDGKRVSAGAVSNYFRHTPALSGGDYYEQVVDADGRQISAVVMSGTDARLTQLHQEIASLRASLAASTNRGSQSRGAGGYARGRGGYGSGGGRGSYQGAPQQAGNQQGQQQTRRPGGGYRGAGWDDEDSKNEFGPR